MSAQCCQTAPEPGGNMPRVPARRRRGGEAAGWVLPAATLALLPKCPLCVAAYLALATGIGLSLQAATCLRATLVGLCVAALLFNAGRLLRKLTPRRTG